MSIEILDWNAGDAEIAQQFQQTGAVVVRGGIHGAELDTFRAAFRRLIVSRLVSLGSSGHEDEDLDDLFNRLIAIGPAYGDQIASIGRDLPEYYNMLGHPGLRRCVSAVMPTRQMLLAYDICLMRIDRPSDDRRNFDWHFDYPYNMLSKSAVTAWVPLTDITEEMGALLLVPGTHDRIWPVELRSSMIGGKGTGHKAFQLSDVDLDELERRSVPLVVKAGDIALLSGFILHRSGVNHSSRTRWVFNPRYGDALEPELVERGWRSVRFSSPLLFQEYHPEFVRKVE
jgi:ectoine hydroxylase-related dioxygenase (phytanoyl-CoA dioxygenase family)